MPKHYRHPIEMELLTQLQGVHPESKCAGRVCVIHNPTDHHMRTWPMNWRGDRGIIERICKHHVGHYDPDHMPLWKSLGLEDNAIHGCCHAGCCIPPEEER